MAYKYFIFEFHLNNFFFEISFKHLILNHIKKMIINVIEILYFQILLKKHLFRINGELISIFLFASNNSIISIFSLSTAI